MAANPSDIDRLIDDARKVVEYASRSGQLPDAALPRAIDAAERDRDAGKPPECASLWTALDKAIRSIAPRTLIDLREGRHPFHSRGQRSARRIVAFLCFVSITLTGLIAWYTIALYEAESALAAIQQIETVRYPDKVREVRRLTEDKELFVKHDARYAHYHQQLGELALARASHNAAAALIEQTDSTGIYPFENFFAAIATLGARALGPSSAQAGTAMTSAPPAIDAISWTETPVPGEAKARSAGPAADLQADFDFLLGIGDDNPAVLLRPATGPQYSFHLRLQKFIFGGWILPFLYGLLGASVYLMRSLLNDRTASFTFFPLILRVALGGIAGLAIGWFSVPGASTGAAGISSIPFGIAFLSGFSIDALFRVLERLTRTLGATPRRSPPVQRA
jgi:hypothetical protein